jgi:hypothetical protein
MALRRRDMRRQLTQFREKGVKGSHKAAPAAEPPPDPIKMMAAVRGGGADEERPRPWHWGASSETTRTPLCPGPLHLGCRECLEAARIGSLVTC